MSDNHPFKKEPKVLNNYARYSGLGAQMAIIILAGTFGGIKLDKIVHLKFPVFTVVLSFSSVILALYVVLKELTGKK
jgi:Putative F0F1-ATPase subunit Ca2+/Mg2+ transporter